MGEPRDARSRPWPILLTLTAAIAGGLTVWLPRCEPGPEDPEERAASPRAAPASARDPAGPDASGREGDRSEEAADSDTPDEAETLVYVEERTGVPVRVVGPGGLPVQYGVAYLIREDGEYLAGMPLSSDGRTVLSAAPGTAAFPTVVARGYAPFVGARLVVRPDMKETLLRMRVGLEIRGRLLACDGVTPVEGLMVEPGMGPLDTALDWRPPLFAAITTADGSFTIRGLPDRLIHLRCGGAAGRGGPVSEPARAGARDVRLVLSRRVEAAFVLVDAATGRAAVSEHIEIREIRDGVEHV